MELTQHFFMISASFVVEAAGVEIATAFFVFDGGAFLCSLKKKKKKKKSKGQLGWFGLREVMGK